MAEYQSCRAPRGQVYYSREGPVEPLPDRGYFRYREVRPQILRVGNPQYHLDAEHPKRRHLLKRKSSPSASLTEAKASLRKFIRRKGLERSPRGKELVSRPISDTSMIGIPTTPSFASFSRSASVSDDSGVNIPDSSVESRNMAQRSDLGEEVRSTTPTPGSQMGSYAPLANEKPVASGNGVSVSINLAEPLLFLQGFDPADFEERNATMLRGSLHLRVTKAAKIKTVSLKFRGKAETEWPEGLWSSTT